jgi:hypothetical protein
VFASPRDKQNLITPGGEYHSDSHMPHFVDAMPIRARSRAIRYLLTTLLVGAFFLLVVGIQGRGRPEGFFILLPTIFIASVLCDLGCGIYAAVLSTALLYALVLPAHTLLAPPRFALPPPFFFSSRWDWRFSAMV